MTVTYPVTNFAATSCIGVRHSREIVKEKLDFFYTCYKQDTNMFGFQHVESFYFHINYVYVERQRGYSPFP